MCGLTSPSQGSVRVLGKDPRSSGEIRKVIGLVPQQERLPPGVNALEFVAMAASLEGMRDPVAAARKAIETVELDPDDSRHLSTYSKGISHRVTIPQPIVHLPPLLILAEPFNA